MKGINRLSAKACQLAKPGSMLHDGAGLYLRVSKAGTKSWLLRYMHKGRRHDLGLGAYPLFGLADARQRATEQRRLLADGVNPLVERHAAARKRDRAETFEVVAEQCIDALSPGWRSDRQAAQWRASLRDYAYPHIGEMPVQELDTPDVLRVLRPIWNTRTETASRVRERIERVIDYSVTAGLRPAGLNPARWRGHLSNALPRPDRVRQTKHHAALPYSEIPAFMATLRARDGIDARALEFCILTAARSNEVLGARWSEIDLAKGVWLIPKERMKQGREHRVPLSDAAVAVIEEMRQYDRPPYVFPGRHGSMGKGVLYILLRTKMQRGDLTTHGFRSTLAQWAAECTRHSFEVREMALAHTVGSQVARAYQRGDLLEQRRELMAEWAAYCAGG